MPSIEEIQVFVEMNFYKFYQLLHRRNLDET